MRGRRSRFAAVSRHPFDGPHGLHLPSGAAPVAFGSSPEAIPWLPVWPTAVSSSEHRCRPAASAPGQERQRAGATEGPTEGARRGRADRDRPDDEGARGRAARRLRTAVRWSARSSRPWAIPKGCSGSRTGEGGSWSSRSTASPTWRSGLPRPIAGWASERPEHQRPSGARSLEQTRARQCTSPARPAPGLRDRQGRGRKDDGRRGSGSVRGRAREADAGMRDGRQRRPRLVLRDRSGNFAGHDVLPGLARHVHGHRGLASRVPEAATAHPGRRPYRPARHAPSTSSPPPPPACARSSPSGSSATRSARSTTTSSSWTPGHRAHRRPARRASGHQPAGEGGLDPAPDRLDARHPVRPGVAPASSSSRLQRRCR